MNIVTAGIAQDWGGGVAEIALDLGIEERNSFSFSFPFLFYFVVWLAAGFWLLLLLLLSQGLLM
jgi:hypothetical protein